MPRHGRAGTGWRKPGWYILAPLVLRSLAGAVVSGAGLRFRFSMKLADLLPTAEQLKSVQGIERKLLERRRTSNVVSAAFAILVAVLQVVLLAGRAVSLPAGGKALSWAALRASVRSALAGPEAMVLLAVGVGAAIFLTLRYSGFLFQESKEPFRYTFSIQEFTRIAGTPGDRFTLAHDDMLKLVHHDLMERLNRRIRRLSLRQEDAQAKDAQDKDAQAKDTEPAQGASGAHIHIEGYYAIREDNDGWLLHVMPRVRIGPATTPSTIAFPVRYPLEREQNDQPRKDSQGEWMLRVRLGHTNPSTTVAFPGRDASETEPPDPRQMYTLGVAAYEQLIERIYSSVATEIYRQIKADVESKIGLFPTAYLRAVARYHEAWDFEKSNTVDSYDQALLLYRSALDAFAGSWWHQWKVRLGKRGVWWWTRPALVADAKTRIGYARCQVFRRIVSQISARTANPLFAIREELKNARDLLEACYDSVMPRPELKFRVAAAQAGVGIDCRALYANLTFPDVSPWRRRRSELYGTLREELSEAYIVSALGCASLYEAHPAKGLVAVAEALQPREDAHRALLFLTKSELEPNLEQTHAYLSRAKEILTDFEIVRYRLATCLDSQARAADRITAEQVEVLNRQYDAVLRINPGNIASLIRQGYLLWLVGDLENAGKKLKTGTDLQDLVSQTFIGDLKYGEARVAAEQAARILSGLDAARFSKDKPPDDPTNAQLDQAARLLGRAFRAYEDAIAADPAVAANYSASSNVNNPYYDLIGPTMLRRYEEFAGRMQKACDTVKEVQGRGWGGALSLPALRVVASYALNDYGNACLIYYLRHEVRGGTPGPRPHLQIAIEQLEAAAPNDAAAYNLAIAYGWRRDAGDEALRFRCLDVVDKRFPNWLEARRIRTSCDLQASRDRIQEAEQKLTDDRRALDEKTKQRDALLEGAEHGTALSLGTGDVLQQKREPLDAQIAGLERGIKEKEEALRNIRREPAEMANLQYLPRITKNNRLAPICGSLAYEPDTRFGESKLNQLLTDGTVDWSRVGDEEALALQAWAEVLSYVDSEWSVALCRHILKAFFREDFNTLRMLCYALLSYKNRTEADDETLREAERTLLNVLERAQGHDPESQFYGTLQEQYFEAYAYSAFGAPGDECFRTGDYDAAIANYENACRKCDAAIYHYSLSLALENKEKQLLDATPPAAGDTAGLRERTIREMQTACALDSQNVEYRTRLRSLKARDWVIQHRLESGLKGLAMTSLIEIYVAAPTILRDLLTEDQALNPDLQKDITALRDSMKIEFGVTLPGVKFRDDQSFPEGKYRILVRDVPVAEGILSGSQREKRQTIVAELGRVGHACMADYYDSQDVLGALNKLPGDQQGAAGIPEDADLVGALTIVLRGLLSEEVPIRELAPIVAAFQRGRSEGRDLVSTVEEIRSLPQLRTALAGNNPELPHLVTRLSAALEAGVEASIDRTWTEPVPRAPSPGSRNVAAALEAALKPMAAHAGTRLVTRAEIRPFVRGFAAPAAVLSEREILPALVARIEGEVG